MNNIERNLVFPFASLPSEITGGRIPATWNRQRQSTWTMPAGWEARLASATERKLLALKFLAGGGDTKQEPSARRRGGCRGSLALINNAK